MAEWSRDVIEMKGIQGWSRQLDDRLTWVCESGRSTVGRVSRWPGLDLKLADFQARYERACLED